MFKKLFISSCLMLVFLVTLAGCGSDIGNNNGNLTLSVTPTDLTGGVFSVVAIATYSNSGKLLQGFPITINASIHTKNGIPLSYKDDLSAGPSGIVTKSYNIQQTTEVIYVDVTASSEGLSDSKSIAIPSIAAMTTSPTVVGFPLASVAGATQTVTISGGFGPYTASIDTGHGADISVNTNGNVISLTKLNNSVTGGPAITAQLTITDSSGATLMIPVSYN